jgi:S-(hydroxymethyl)glutathione dehydrogenase/alcohol dehydrogenase
VGLDGKTTLAEQAQTALKLQGGSKSAIETAAKAVRKAERFLLSAYTARAIIISRSAIFSRATLRLKWGSVPRIPISTYT